MNNLQKSEFTVQEINLVDLINQPTWKTILLELVKSTKMDPWNINIVSLADAYFSKISEMESKNLRVPANAILCSSILLKHKSKTLKIPSIQEFEQEHFYEAKEFAKKREKLFLSEGIPELIASRLTRQGKVSLDDLVLSIESILNKTKRKALSKDRLNQQFEIPIQEYNIEERMHQVLEDLHNLKDEMGLVLFSELVKNKSVLEKIHTFVVLLFLHNQEKVFLVQEIFFGEIFISLPDNPNRTLTVAEMPISVNQEETEVLAD